MTTEARPGRLIGRGFWITMLLHLLLLLVLIGATVLAVELGGQGGGLVAALTFIPALVVVEAVYLLVVVIITVVKASRSEIRPGAELLLGWMAGAALLSGTIALVFTAFA